MDPRSANPTSAPHAAAPNASGRWSNGLFRCYEDPYLCCTTCFYPCVTFGQIAEIVDGGRTSCIFSGLIYYGLLHFGSLPCLYSCTYRTKLRALYSLPKTPCSDCCVHFCCNMCALNQEYRELRNRGFDPALGWTVNVERRNAAAATAPPFVAPGMTR